MTSGSGANLGFSTADTVVVWGVGWEESDVGKVILV